VRPPASSAAVVSNESCYDADALETCASAASAASAIFGSDFACFSLRLGVSAVNPLLSLARLQ